MAAATVAATAVQADDGFAGANVCSSRVGSAVARLRRWVSGLGRASSPLF